MKRVKNILVVALLLVAGWRTNAQGQEAFSFGKNELKVDVAYILATTLKVEYEHLINDWSSSGIIAAYNFSGNKFVDIKF